MNYFKFVFIFLSINLNAQEVDSVDSDFDPYISEAPVVNFNVLDTNLNQYKIFFTGENHYYSSENSKIEMEMLKYFHKNAGVRNVIIELGFSRGYMLNKYVNGDTAYFKELEGTTAKVFLYFYKKLRDWNMSLPDSNRITIHGVDIERFKDDGPVLMSKLLPNYLEVPESIQMTVEAIHSLSEYKKKYYNDYYDRRDYGSEKGNQSGGSYYYYPFAKGYYDANSIDSILSNIQSNIEVYKLVLKDKFAVFENIVNSLKENRQWEETSNNVYQNIYRERIIYSNISKLMKADSNAKFYGQFGRCHINKEQSGIECGVYAFNSVVNRLNTGIAKNKVMSIAIFYKKNYYNSKYYRSGADFAKYDLDYIDFSKYAKFNCSDSTKIFKVKQSDSVLKNKFNFIVMNDVCDTKNSTKSKLNNKYDRLEWIVSLDFDKTYHFYNLASLNQGIFSNDSIKFKSPMISFGGGISVTNFGTYFSFNYKQIQSQKIGFNKLSYTISGSQFGFNFGGDIPVTHYFHLMPHFSYTYQSLKFEMESDTLDVKFPFVPSANDNVIHRNNSFSIGVGLQAKFAVTRFFGLNAGALYLFDPSNKHWRNSGKLDRQSPKTSLSHIQIGFGACIIIQQ